MQRYWALIGRWLVGAGIAIPTLAIISAAVLPGAKEWPLVFGFLWLGAVLISLPLTLAGAGLCTAHVIARKRDATKTDYVFLAVGLNGVLLLLVFAGLILVRT